MANVNHLFLNNILYFLKKHICNNKNRLSVPAGFQFPFRRFAISDKTWTPDTAGTPMFLFIRY